MRHHYQRPGAQQLPPDWLTLHNVHNLYVSVVHWTMHLSFFNSLSPKGYKINPYFTHICEHCSTKSPSIHWVFQKVALTTGGQTQANAVHVIQPLNSSFIKREISCTLQLWKQSQTADVTLHIGRRRRIKPPLSSTCLPPRTRSWKEKKRSGLLN